MSQSAGNGQRAFRLLRNLRKVLNHDLPNQVVVVHGLLQLLKMDEKGRLSAEGQEYLNRSEAACKRVLHVLDTLKKILDIDNMPTGKESVSLVELLREVSAAAKQMFNGGPIEVAPLPVKAMLAPRAALHQALLQLVPIARPAGTQARVQISVVARAETIEFWIGAAPSPVAPHPTLSPRGRGQEGGKPAAMDSVKGVENRLALMYVQELTESWGGTLKIGDDPSFVVTVPQTREGS